MLTNREFFERVITRKEIDSAMVEKATALLAKLDEKNDKAKDKRKEKHKEDEPIMTAILSYLAEHHAGLASDLATACGVSTSKIVAVAKNMEIGNQIGCRKVKVKGVGERNEYFLLAETE